MKKEKIFWAHTLKYSNDIDLLDKVITIFSFVEFRDALTKQQRNVLRYYLNFGYSSMIKDAILSDLKMTDKHLTQVNFHLQKKGYLYRHETNFKEKVVSDTLIKMKEMFLSTVKDSSKQAVYAVLLEKE